MIAKLHRLPALISRALLTPAMVTAARVTYHVIALARSSEENRRIVLALGLTGLRGGAIEPAIKPVMAGLAQQGRLGLSSAILDAARCEISQAAAVMEQHRYRLWKRLGWAMTVGRGDDLVDLPYPVQLVAAAETEGHDLRVGDVVFVPLRYAFARRPDGQWDDQPLALRVERTEAFGPGSGVLVGTVLSPPADAASHPGIEPGDELLFQPKHVVCVVADPPSAPEGE